MATERVVANDLRSGSFVIVGDKVGKIKMITRNKTGKHGVCKVHARCKEVRNGKTVDLAVGSQDDVDVVRPTLMRGYRCSQVDKRAKKVSFVKISEKEEEHDEDEEDDEKSSSSSSVVVVEKLSEEWLEKLEEVQEDEDFDCVLMDCGPYIAVHSIVQRK